jgi:hypothetical protein
VLYSSVAVAATGVAVSGGVLQSNADSPVNVAADFPQVNAGDDVSTDAVRRDDEVSRSSDRRRSADPAKAAALAGVDRTGTAVSRTEDISDEDPREIAKALLSEFGYSQDEFGCLDSLYMSESGWRVDADNPSSSAYGIPQALPGSKMASAGSDWETNPVTQIRWGLGYIQDRYGSPCGAWGFKQGHNWY